MKVASAVRSEQHEKGRVRKNPEGQFGDEQGQEGSGKAKSRYCVCLDGNCEVVRSFAGLVSRLEGPVNAKRAGVSGLGQPSVGQE